MNIVCLIFCVNIMNIGVLTVPFGEQSLGETFTYLNDIGVGAVEIGCDGSPGEDHLDRHIHLDNEFDRGLREGSGYLRAVGLRDGAR